MRCPHTKLSRALGCGPNPTLSTQSSPPLVSWNTRRVFRSLTCIFIPVRWLHLFHHFLFLMCFFIARSAMRLRGALAPWETEAAPAPGLPRGGDQAPGQGPALLPPLPLVYLPGRRDRCSLLSRAGVVCVGDAPPPQVLPPPPLQPAGGIPWDLCAGGGAGG